MLGLRSQIADEKEGKTSSELERDGGTNLS